jgi:reductive dehalogenase
MAIVNRERKMRRAAAQDSHDETGAEPFPVPYLGRSVRIVGPVANVDPKQLPHPMNQRGELGRALYNWRHNTVSEDPMGRVDFENHSADRNHVLPSVLRRVPKGKTNERRLPVSDPAAMSRHIKRVAKYLGLDVVGIGKSHPSFLYAGKSVDGTTGTDGEPLEAADKLARKLPYVIAGTVAWDYKMTQAHRHRIGDAAYDFTGQQTNLILSALEGYIRELGYNTLRGAMNGQAAALAAGNGELGRNGLIITEKFGARVHASDAIMTDLPLVADKPLDIGVADFCKVCRKCAVTCPTNSISFDEDRSVINGVEKYKINWLTCYKLRPYVAEHWVNCLTCVTVCPYTKPNTWWHSLAIRSLKSSPIPMRPLVAHGLKWLDDRIWGTVPRKRVRWLGYDTGVKPGEKACTVAGCTAAHGQASDEKTVIPLDNIGYYAPLKENTNRFFKRD